MADTLSEKSIKLLRDKIKELEQGRVPEIPFLIVMLKEHLYYKLHCTCINEDDIDILDVK